MTLHPAIKAEKEEGGTLGLPKGTATCIEALLPKTWLNITW